MAALDDLISQIPDESLRERIRAEMKRANRQKKFGLVFEEHLPEATPLYDIPVKRGSVVAKKDGQVTDIYYVEKIEDGQANCFHKATKERVVLPVDVLVCVAQFGEPIYPYLQPLDTVCNAPDSDLWHTLIEADNYHALQLLEYLYAGKVDCIYIDPPYNTGVRDWKYNNNYVDGNDTYRHSKWLSMMEKRLKIAKRLLNPEDSVLIVTIDEKEYLHLGCLLEEMFPEARMQMVSSVINPAGAGRQTEFARTDEYLYFVQLGNSSILPESRETENVPVIWDTLRRSSLANARGRHGKGACGPNQFYPIYVNDTTGRIERIGEPVFEGIDRFTAPQIEGCTAVFPVRPDGTEMNWGIKPEEARERLAGGYLRAGKHTPSAPQQYVISYVTGGNIKDIDAGIAVIDGYEPDGSVRAYYPKGRDKMPTTNWNRPTHDAQRFGTNILTPIIGGRFPYPKSLYAVKDCLRFFVANKPEALVIDFFAGSGTTLHAINLMNAEDGGHRRCILVTNNEVSNAEEKSLVSRGYQPGDEEWSNLGIARYVTWPRTVCSIEGHDVNGKPLKGDYITSGEEPMHMADGFKANAAFFKLGFLDKNAVALGRQFKELLPVLWLKAGAHGPCPALEETAEVPAMLVLPVNHFAVLTDESQYEAFAAQVNGEEAITTVYIVTDSEPGYREMVSGLHAEDTYQLYRDYLDNFRINHGGR
ncbi:MAG: site-specific DNA-methyltransferase [Evtepia sp.]